jgi:hypothetical protein
MTPELYAAIVEAERAAQHAHSLAYKQREGYWLRTRLGKAQSILIHYVVKHAGGSA